MKNFYIFIICIFFAAIASAQSPVTNITQETGHPTIQDAIDNANNNDTIYILGGDYYENLVIKNFNSLTIAAYDYITAGTYNVELIGTHSGIWPEFGIAMTNSTNVTITGLKISAYYHSIDLYDSPSNTINACGMYTNDNAGIYIDGYNSDNNKIISNNIYGINTDIGISIKSGTDMKCLHNNIYHTGNSTFDAAIELRGGTDNTYISNNSISAYHSLNFKIFFYIKL